MLLTMNQSVENQKRGFGGTYVAKSICTLFVEEVKGNVQNIKNEVFIRYYKTFWHKERFKCWNVV